MEEESRQSTQEEIEKATVQGWKDDPDHPNYKEAYKFLEDGERIAPIAAKKAARLEAEMAEQKKLLHALREDLLKERIEGEKRGYAKAKQELERRKQTAYENEDLDELKRIDREEKDLKPPEEIKAAPKPEVNRDFLEWRESNDWYGDTEDDTNFEMTMYADSIGPALAERMPGTPLKKVYAEVERRVKARFPEKFGKKETHATVETSGAKPPKQTGKKTWANLPRDIRDEAEANGYVKKYFGGDKEKYAESAWKTLNI